MAGFILTVIGDSDLAVAVWTEDEKELFELQQRPRWDDPVFLLSYVRDQGPSLTFILSRLGRRWFASGFLLFA